MELTTTVERDPASSAAQYRVGWRLALSDEERDLVARFGITEELRLYLDGELDEALTSGITYEETYDEQDARQLVKSIKKACQGLLTYLAHREQQDPVEGTTIFQFSLKDLRERLGGEEPQPPIGFQVKKRSGGG